MKTLISILFFGGTIITFLSPVFSQEKTSIPSVNLKTLDGKPFNTSEISNPGKPIILSFWATWCHPCIKELNAYNENYTDWKGETGVKIFAISIDDSKSINRVAPLVAGKNWDFDVFLDTNSDFKRAMNVINIPHTFLVDGTGKIVYQHTSYAEGDEIALYELIKKLAKGKTIEK